MNDLTIDSVCTKENHHGSMEQVREPTGEIIEESLRHML
jgi:hypothetical protein